MRGNLISHFIILMFCAFISSFSYAQQGVIRVGKFGGVAVENTINGVSKFNGGYQVYGNTGYPNGIYILQYDTTLNEISRRNFGGMTGVALLADGGYITLQTQRDAIHNWSDDYCVIKYDMYGGMLWRKYFGGFAAENANSITLLPNGNVLIIGNSASTDGDVVGKSTTDPDIWLIEVNPSGQIVRQKVIGGNDEEINAGIYLDGNEFIVFCNTYSNNGVATGYHGGGDILLMHLDGNLNLQWSRCIGGSGEDLLAAIMKTPSGDIYLGGSSYSTDGDIPGLGTYTDGFVVRLNSSGSPVWSKVFSGSWYDEVSGIIMMSNGNLAVSGTYASGEMNDISRPVQHEYGEGMLIVMKPDGEILWTKSIGGSCDDRTNGIIEAYNGNLLVWGSYLYCSTNGDFTGSAHVPGESNGYLMELTNSMNTIKGSIYFDNNNNKIKDAGENYYISSYGHVEASNANYFSRIFLLNGKFLISTDTGKYSSSLKLGGELDPSAYGFAPKKKITHFVPGFTKDSFDFRIAPIGLIKDLELTVTQPTNSYVNNSLRYLVHIKNLGGASIDSALIKIRLSDKLSFLSASKTPLAINSDSIFWKFTAVPGFFHDSIELVVKIDNSVSTIGASIGLSSLTEPYISDFDTLDNKTNNASVVLGQNAAISNFTMGFTVKDSARTSRPVKYDIVYGFTHLLDSLKGQVKVIKSSLSSFVSAVPAPVSVSADTITWNFKDLASFNADTIQVVLRVADTPAVALGAIVQHKVRIQLETTDTTNLFIEKTLSQRIVGYYIEPDMTNPRLTAPNGIKWTRAFGGTGKDHIHSVVALPDSGYIITGSSNSMNNDIITSDSYYTDAFITRYDKSGMVKWTKAMGVNEDDALFDIIATSDSNFVACGTIRMPYQPQTQRGGEEGWLVKFNSMGDTLWTRKLGSVGLEIFYDIKETPDKGFIVNGQTTAGGGDVTGYIPTGDYNWNMWIVKLDSLGNIQWQKCIAEPLLGYIGTGVDLTADGKIIVGGEILPENRPPDRMGYVAKLDTNGVLLWSRKFNYLHLSYAVAEIIANPDSTSIIVGYAGTFWNDTLYFGGHGQTDAWITKLGNDGEVLWTKYFGGTYFDDARSIHRTASGNFLVAGRSFSGDGNMTLHYGSQNTGDALLMEIDPDGKLIWQHTIGGTGIDNFEGLTILASGDIVAVGNSSSNDWDIHGAHGGESDGLIAKYGLANHIVGQVFVDKNNNGIKDLQDPPFSNGIIQIGNPGFIRATPLKDGKFTVNTDIGNYIVSLNTSDTGYFEIIPQADTVHFTEYIQRDTVDFRLVSTNPVNDLRVELLPLSIPRPGFNSNYQIKYENKGTTDLMNAELKFVMDNRTQFLSSNPVHSLIKGDTIIWVLNQLNSFESGSIDFNLKIKPPPDVQFGTILSFTALIEPLAGDTTPLNNITKLDQEARGSFDPNDKAELHNGRITPLMIEGKENLVYVIRFQNTGNDTAFNIYIRDTLDSKLDWASLEMISSSHNYELSITQGGRLEWQFNNILLPDSNVNEPASHGFISFRIKPKPDLQLSDTVKNNASIYFDFNLPVATNTVETSIVNDLSTTCAGGNILLVAKYPGTLFKWQVNTGTGYVDISDNSVYNGSVNDTFSITGASSGWYGYKYRCRITTVNGVVYSPEYKLKIQSVWKGTISKAWENPANWNCGIVPDENTDIVIEAGLNNYPEVGSNANCRSILIKPSASITIKPGFNLTLKGR